MIATLWIGFWMAVIAVLLLGGIILCIPAWIFWRGGITLYANDRSQWNHNKGRQ